jgi:hypothetical protein
MPALPAGLQFAQPDFDHHPPSPGPILGTADKLTFCLVRSAQRELKHVPVLAG